MFRIFFICIFRFLDISPFGLFTVPFVGIEHRRLEFGVQRSTSQASCMVDTCVTTRGSMVFLLLRKVSGSSLISFCNVIIVIPF